MREGLPVTSACAAFESNHWWTIQLDPNGVISRQPATFDRTASMSLYL
jgi:hypothetical protein